MDLFTGIYFLALIIEIMIRAPIDRKRRQGKISQRRVTTQEQILLGLLTLGGFIAPLVYAVLSPARPSRGADDARFVWDRISGIYEKHRWGVSENVNVSGDQSGVLSWSKGLQTLVDLKSNDWPTRFAAAHTCPGTPHGGAHCQGSR